jgi:secondary thiamine-phosphate synthase enzyme
MIIQREIMLPAYARGYHLITRFIEEQLPAGLGNGLVHVFIQHTSAGLTINENADPSVRMDFESTFNRMVPDGLNDYVHSLEGPDDMPAHIKSSLLGASVTIPLSNGKLNLGTWQGIYLCEFRNHPTRRRIIISIYT